MQLRVRRRMANEKEIFGSLAGRLSRLHPRRRLDEIVATAGRFAVGLLRGLKSRHVRAACSANLPEDFYARSRRWF